MGQKQAFTFTITLKEKSFDKWITIIEWNEREAILKLLLMIRDYDKEITAFKLQMTTDVWE